MASIGIGGFCGAMGGFFLNMGAGRLRDMFGNYVVKSATTGQEPAPQGSECEVSPDGAQSCTQTVQVGLVRIDGEWKISELTLLTTS